MRYDPEHRLAAGIRPLIPPGPHGVLEIGCGDGSLSVQLAGQAERYVAIDPDAEAIGKARSLASSVDFRTGTGEALAFADASFDAVLFILSLHHQDSRIALEEAHRVLTREGWLIVLEPSAEGELQQFFHLFHDESQALEKAAGDIRQSRFQLLEHHRIDALAEFESLEDLCRYSFDRTAIDPADRGRIQAKLQQLRGPVSPDQPIVLKDTIQLYSLRKGPI
jgi:ubiquinone/menaquinone biosynthesis C-methylase UbiE